MELRDLLIRVEFASIGIEAGVPYPTCPICAGGDPTYPRTPSGHRGHRAGCALEAQLEAARKEAQNG